MDVLPTRISQYEIRRVLGQGGMGIVYLAFDPALQRQVALKVLRSDNAELRERFRREARTIARLQHPNIVSIYAVGEHEQQPFLAMEHIDGEPLSEGIRRRAPWGLQRKLMIGADLCAGLAFAHRAGVIHRDVKPSNLMIANGSGTVRLLDFGIARGADAAATMGLTMHGNIVGTMNYMSPEQITGQPVDHRSDIFAVGLVLYELLSYCQAFPGANLATLTYRIVHGEPQPLGELEPDLDPELIAVVERAMARAPGDRYPHLEAMRTDLLRIASRLSPTAAATLASDDSGQQGQAAHGPPPIWSRALDPTVDAAGPVTPMSTAPLPPVADAPSPARPGKQRPAWVIPVAATGTLLGAATALWLGTRTPGGPPAVPADGSAGQNRAQVTRQAAGPRQEPHAVTRSASPASPPRTQDPAAIDGGQPGSRVEAPAARPSPAPPRSNENGSPTAILRPASEPSPVPPSTSLPPPPQFGGASAGAPPTPRPESTAAADAPAAPAVGREVERREAVSTPPTVVAGPSDVELVQAVIGRWASAYASRDARGVDAVMPGAEATYAKQFSNLRAASTALSGCRTTVQEVTATAECTEQFAFEWTVGGGNRGTRQRRFTLRKAGGEWRITATSVSQ